MAGQVVVRRTGLISAFPLLIVVLIAYNLLVFGWVTLDGDAGGVETFLRGQFSMTLISGDVWYVSLGDLLLAFSLILLFFEFVKASGTETPTIVNHALSFGVFVIALIEFVAVKGFGNSIFFLFLVIVLIDVVAGFITTIVSARRDFGSGGAPLVTN
jgi:hypothetical protein